MSQKPPPAYEEWEPYSFVTYSHFDAGEVYPEILWLQSHGHRIWYDRGIQPGSIWQEHIAERIERCERLIYFVSRSSAESEHCKREVRFALEEGRPVVAVYLEEIRLPAGMRLGLSHRQAIMKHQLDAASYRRQLGSVVSASVPASKSRDLAVVQADGSGERFRVSIRYSEKDPDPVVVRLCDAITRYVTWQGGVFQAQTSDASDPDYVVVLDVAREGESTEIRWEVAHLPSGDIAGSGHLARAAASLLSALDQIATTIGADALSKLVDHENRNTAGMPSQELSFRQLILRADRPLYLDREDLSVRAQDLDQAKSLDANAGLPRAAAASLIAWRIRNGASSDPAGEAETARKEAQHALRYEGNDPAVLLKVGITYARLRDPAAALTILQRAHAMAPTLEAKDQLARCLSFNGDPEAAIAMFNEILTTMPDGYPFRHIRLAMVQIQLGRLEAALESTRVFTAQFPGDHYGWFVLANLLEQLGDTPGAQSALRNGRENEDAPELDRIIAGTEALWGHTDAQRAWLTDGWRSLENKEGSGS